MCVEIVQKIAVSITSTAIKDRTFNKVEPEYY